jgi:hypothetical protein
VTTTRQPDAETKQSSYRRFGEECFFERRTFLAYLNTTTSSYIAGSQPIAYAQDQLFDTSTRDVYCGPYAEPRQVSVPRYVERLTTPECLA